MESLTTKAMITQSTRLTSRNFSSTHLKTNYELHPSAPSELTTAPILFSTTKPQFEQNLNPQSYVKMSKKHSTPKDEC